jgi:hypothetical protein
MEMSEQEQADLWQEIRRTWCHRLNVPEFDRKAFNAFVAQRIAQEASE